MNIKGESIQNGEPTPEHPVEIENKINLTGAIQILNKLKSKVNLVKADEKEYRLPYLISIEKQAIDTVLSELEKQDNKIKELEGRCRNLDKEAQSYLEELMGDSTLKNRTIKQLQEENEELNYKLHSKKIALEIYNRYIPKSKLKEFFSSRLEKYQEADDGKYEQDYLTRGELELVDRYKECKEIAKIILEEEINSEVPQNCIPKSLVKEKIEEYKACGIEEGDYHIFQEEINALQDLLERSEGR